MKWAIRTKGYNKNMLLKNTHTDCSIKYIILNKLVSIKKMPCHFHYLKFVLRAVSV